VGVVVLTVMAVEAEVVVMRSGFFDLQKHPHYQHPCCRSLGIASGLLDDHHDETGLDWGAGSAEMSDNII
jgi:hypothetical protein